MQLISVFGGRDACKRGAVKLLRADEASAWLKARRKSRPPSTVSFPWPEDPAARLHLAESVASLSEWRGAAVVLEKPGMPRQEHLASLCALHETLGVASTPGDIQLGKYPGHFFDGTGEENRAAAQRLLDIMMAGHIEGHLVTKSGRFWATIDCGIVDFRVADKSLAGAVRALVREVAGETDGAQPPLRRRRTTA